MNNLNLDILEIIIFNVALVEDSKNFLRLVKISKTFKYVVEKSYSLWNNLEYILNDKNKHMIEILHKYPIKHLDCDDIQSITKNQLNKMTTLTQLYCNNTNITDNEIQNLTMLKKLQCNNTNITNKGIKKLINLKELHCQNTTISDVGIKNCRKLIKLECSKNQQLYIFNVQLQQWVIDPIRNLLYNGITDNGIIKLTSLIYLRCYNTKITDKGAKKLTNLTYLDSNYNFSLKLQHKIHNKQIQTWTKST